MQRITTAEVEGLSGILLRTTNYEWEILFKLFEIQVSLHGAFHLRKLGRRSNIEQHFPNTKIANNWSDIAESNFCFLQIVESLEGGHTERVGLEGGGVAENLADEVSTGGVEEAALLHHLHTEPASASVHRSADEQRPDSIPHVSSVADPKLLNSDTDPTCQIRIQNRIRVLFL